MKGLTLLLILFSVISCGSDNSDSGGRTKVNPALEHIKSLEGMIPLVVGQTKSFSSLVTNILPSGERCEYWEHNEIEIASIEDEVVNETINRSYSPIDRNSTMCSDGTDLEEDIVISSPIEERVNYFKNFIRKYTDHEYRCSLEGTCISSKLILIENRFLRGREFKYIETEYLYDNDREFILKVYVSKNSLFEGVVDYRLDVKSTGKWLLRRVYRFSIID